MPGNAGGQGSEEDSPYLIDETVELEDFGDRYGYVWEIEEDMDPESEYVVRSITRGHGTFEVHILPVEEAEAFEEGENYWPEWSSGSDDKIRAHPSIDTDNEEPYLHSGDLRLAVERTSGHTEEITMKFRERN